jgi:hypothetical protein
MYPVNIFEIHKNCDDTVHVAAFHWLIMCVALDLCSAL